jgi:hypothetical protein
MMMSHVLLRLQLLATTMAIAVSLQFPRHRHCNNGGMTIRYRPPALLTAATASLVLQAPLESQAYFTSTTTSTTTSAIMAITDYNHPTTTNLYSSSISSSMLQLASSTITKPIGELKVDDSATTATTNTAAILNSIGQWFFVLYVAVSIIAGTKEMVRRITKRRN